MAQNVLETIDLILESSQRSKSAQCGMDKNEE